MAGGKKKQKNVQQNKTNQNLSAKETLTIEDVKESKSEEDFNKIKDALIKQLEKEIGEYEKIKEEADKASQKAQESKKDLEKEVDELKGKKKELSDDVTRLNREKNELNSQVDSLSAESQKIISEAKEKADEISTEAGIEADKVKADAEENAKKLLQDTEKEKIKVINDAKNEAQKIWKKQIDSLQAQIEDIAARETALNEQKISLQKEKNELELEKEELEELINHNVNLKNKYLATNPAKVSELEIEIKDEKEKYESLLERYNTLSKKYNESQIVLDTIKTEVITPEGGKASIGLSTIVSDLKEIQDKYDQLKRIHEKYQDENVIFAIEEKAGKVDKLEKDIDELIHERNTYKEEVYAARNTKEELRAYKAEIDATKTLNDHLLKELESHKTALESRTGDTCPALSKVDAEIKADEFIQKKTARSNKFKLTNLAQIVTYVKHFAGSGSGNNGVKLYYSDNDIRAFLAGMAVSRLIILQGMSGTGKSSLPEVFAEAISGFQKLIPVESSWRDRNELLGYYNDFNKKFNAKTFTIELYRYSKKACEDIPSFIILDEMNLARIEYYFSDFLSILQNADKDEWIIELVSSDMRTLPMELSDEDKINMKKDNPALYSIWQKIENSRKGDLLSEITDKEKEQITDYLGRLNKLTGAKDLIDGRKIKVTDNIWFIGTANRDESTFEISDKVYDRAQVISLNKKGKPEGTYKRPQKSYLSLDDLREMFNTAKSKFSLKEEVENRLDVLDEKLMSRFDISFGNRIVTQSIDFAAVFVAAGGTLKDAMDYQISTKIIRKIISSDDQEALMDLMTVTEDYPETQRLLEKRIEELGR